MGKRVFSRNTLKHVFLFHAAMGKRVFSRNTLKHVFLFQNNQDRQQNKLAYMVNGSNLLKHHYWPLNQSINSVTSIAPKSSEIRDI